MSSLSQDLRYAVRQMWRQRSFSAIVIVTLALGVGAATTAFSILNAVALKPPSYSDVERLVSVYTSTRDSGGRAPVPAGAVADLSAIGVFQSAVAYATRGVNAGGTASAERLNSAEITGDLFTVLGARFELGRAFLPEEHQEGTQVAVVGHSVWTRLYAASTGVLGSTIVLDGRPHAIVGVAPEGFGFPGATDVWVPFARSASANRGVWMIGRLTDGTTVEQADAALQSASSAIDAVSRPPDAWRTARIVPLHESLISRKHQNAATVLLIATGLVLVMACANLAGLFLANVAGRRQELALRAAIGAERMCIARLLMTESLVFSAVGGALGVLVAQWGIALFVATLGRPAGAGWMEFGVDRQVLVFALGVSTLAALLFGLAPALTASNVDIRGVLQEGAGQAGTSRRGGRYRRVLVAAQVAVSLALVVASSSVVASSLRLDKIPTGFDGDGLLRARVSLAGPAYEQPAQRLAFVDRVVERLSGPRVAAISATSHVPLIDRDISATRVIVNPTLPEQQQPIASVRFVAGDYLETMRIPVLRGRSFTVSESRDTRTQAVIVNETMARRHWADADPIGRTVRLAGPTRSESELVVIGVVGDVAQRQLPATGENQIYLPLAEARELSIVARAAGDPADLAHDVRAAIAAVDRALPVATQTMREMYGWYGWDRRAQGLVLGAVGTVALLLAALGIYGVMSLLVTHRTREIGVRIALGSTTGAILRLMVGAGLRLASVGMAIGLLLGLAATVGLSAIFFGVQPFDYRVFVFAAGLLGSAALIASWWPARRAMRVNPMVVLKSER